MARRRRWQRSVERWWWGWAQQIKVLLFHYFLFPLWSKYLSSRLVVAHSEATSKRRRSLGAAPITISRPIPPALPPARPFASLHPRNRWLFTASYVATKWPRRAMKKIRQVDKGQENTWRKLRRCIRRDTEIEGRTGKRGHKKCKKREKQKQMRMK